MKNKKLIRTFQIILGIFFVASGLAKGLTPMSTAAKIDEYFLILGLDYFTRFDLITVFLLNITEVTIGVMFILNIYPKLTLWASTLLMVVFTPKTLYVAITGAMTYSGCFGEVIQLTPWQSHWKNVVMDLLLIAIWIGYKSIPRTKLTEKQQQIIIGLTVLTVFIYQLLML